MGIGNIEIFAALEGDRLKAVEALFTPKQFGQGVEVITFGESVDGLYLVTGGDVEVFIPGYEGVLAVLSEGNSFGELSLFHPDELASATVKVASESADFLFCQREALAEALQADAGLAAGFYHGSALMMASRLKSTNKKISGEIAQSINTAMELVEEIASSRKLGVAQQEISTAGSSIVSGMTDIVKKLLVMKQSEELIDPKDIAKLADSAKEIYYSEFQVFDRVAQQLHLLGQHLDNVKRILNQQEADDVDVNGKSAG